MINLIRNELTKIFCKKAIYVYTIVIALMFVSSSSVLKENGGEVTYNEDYMEIYESNLKEYDLNDKQQIRMYVGDRVYLDVYK